MADSYHASDIAQARVFLALLNSEIDDLAARIEATVLLERNARANGHLIGIPLAFTRATTRVAAGRRQ